jgi:hypothetical protein
MVLEYKILKKKGENQELLGSYCLTTTKGFLLLLLLPLEHFYKGEEGGV